MDKCREEFEKWSEKFYDFGRHGQDMSEYSSPLTQRAWNAWQASRAAINVELPKASKVDARYKNHANGSSYHVSEDVYYADWVNAALENAGINL